MTGLKIFLLMTVSCFISASVYADIYEWTDKDGIRHFTNYAPPPEAEIMMKTDELPYDEAADDARMEMERAAQLERTRTELAERTLALEKREAEAEQKLAEADRKAEELLRESEKLLDEPRYDTYDSGDIASPWYYYGYYPDPYRNRYYYRNETGSIYFLNRPRIRHDGRHRYKKYQYGRNRAYGPNKNHGRKYGAKKTYPRHRHNRSFAGGHSSFRPFGGVHSISP